MVGMNQDPGTSVGTADPAGTAAESLAKLHKATACVGIIGLGSVGLPLA
jgi:hypothetical protein